MKDIEIDVATLADGSQVNVGSKIELLNYTTNKPYPDSIRTITKIKLIDGGKDVLLTFDRAYNRRKNHLAKFAVIAN